MLDPEQAESRQDDIVARTRDLVEKSKGTWHSHDAWVRRRLA
jgi:ribosomal protein S6